MTEPEPIVVRSVTVAELMDGDGNRYISFDTEGDPEYWDQLGLLEFAAASVRLDIERMWSISEDDEA